jgi:glucose-1-phosphate cytidylyltransferase
MQAEQVPVFVLCGGQGTRLREETEFRPKPMVMIGDRPILWHIMKLYSHYGFNDFSLCLGYRADMIRDYFLNYRANTSKSCVVDLKTGRTELSHDVETAEDWRVNLIDTGLDALTGLRVKRALKFTKAKRFLLTYGDGVSNVDVGALIAHHERSGRLATITAVRPSSRFGELDLRGDRVKSFLEKPQTGEGWINGGFMVFERAAFDVLQNEDNQPLETAVLQLLSQQEQLSVYRHDGFWQCMDTYREMQLLNDLWNGQNPAWRVW